MAKKLKAEKTWHTPRLVRCRTEFSVTLAPNLEESRRFGAGQVIDLDEEITSGQKLESYIRQGCIDDLLIDSPVLMHQEEEIEDKDDDDTDRA